MGRDNIEATILAFVERMGAETHTEEIAKRLSIVRHTAAKYLEVLRGKGLVRCRKVGNAKLWQPITAGFHIRPLRPVDLQAMLEIYEETKSEKSDTTRKSFVDTVRYYLANDEATISLGAELQGKLAGFIIGEIRGPDLKNGEPIGWIKALEVSSEFHNQKIGQVLGEALLQHFRQRKIHQVRILIEWFSENLVAHFRALGFEIMPLLPLEKKVQRLPQPAKHQSSGHHSSLKSRDRPVGVHLRRGHKGHQ